MTEQEVEAGIELLKALKNTRDLTLLDAIRIDAKCSEVSWVNIVQQLNLFGLVKYHWLNGTISILPAGIKYLNKTEVTTQ